MGLKVDFSDEVESEKLRNYLDSIGISYNSIKKEEVESVFTRSEFETKVFVARLQTLSIEEI